MTAEHAAAAGGEVEALLYILAAHNETVCTSNYECHCKCGYVLPKCTRRERLRHRDALIADWYAATRATAADTVLATARRLCCGDNPAPEHNARAEHSQRMAFAEELARAVRGS